jgi:hypothetical protein
MNKKLLLAFVAVFVTWFLGSFVVHGVLLHDDYAGLPNIMRTEADVQRYFPLMILARVFLAAAFVWIYSRGVEATPWLPQGLRFGLAVAFLTIVPTYIIYFVVQPMPSALVCKQIVFDGILLLINGVVVAAVFRKP